MFAYIYYVWLQTGFLLLDVFFLVLNTKKICNLGNTKSVAKQFENGQIGLKVYQKLYWYQGVENKIDV